MQLIFVHDYVRLFQRKKASVHLYCVWGLFKVNKCIYDLGILFVHVEDKDGLSLSYTKSKGLGRAGNACQQRSTLEQELWPPSCWVLHVSQCC